jgi:hypothetical protein
MAGLRRLLSDGGGRTVAEDARRPEALARAGRRPNPRILADCIRAAQHRAVAAVDDSLRLIKGCHAFDVSRPLAGDQQPFQMLRIARWLAGMATLL